MKEKEVNGELRRNLSIRSLLEVISRDMVSGSWRRISTHSPVLESEASLSDKEF